MLNTDWKDYEIIATGNGEKLERWGNVILLRPDPQVIWEPPFELSEYKGLNARYVRQGGGGGWEFFSKLPESWVISWKNLNFKVMPMGFKHTGLFPEQALNWAKMSETIKKSGRKDINVLNLFAYTGGATLACMQAGANVCHVDAAKAMVERAGENIDISKLDRSKVRFIVDDCIKFVKREIKRGKKYDAIIMDPPSYGRGPNGEMWKIESSLFPLVKLTAELLSDNPLFYLINSYTTGLQPTVIKNIILSAIDRSGKCEAYEVCLPTSVKGVELPCGASAFMEFK